jgi:PAS domain S-box-containing protein
MTTENLQDLTSSISYLQRYKTSMKWLLDDRQEEFWAIFDQTAIGIAQIRLDGHWLLANAKLCNLLGWSREELIVQPFLECLHPDDRGTTLNYINSFLNLDHPASDSTNNGIELRFIHKTSKTIWVHCTLSMVQNAIGGPKSFIAMIQDISARKQVEQQINEQFALIAEQEQLEARSLQFQTSASLQTFVNGISHELNNMLTPILGITQLLQIKHLDTDEKTQELLSLLEASAKRAAEFVKQMGNSKNQN